MSSILAHGLGRFHTAARTATAVNRTAARCEPNPQTPASPIDRRPLDGQSGAMSETHRGGPSMSAQSIAPSVASTSTIPAVALRDVRKVYGQGDGRVIALDGVSVVLAPGSFTAVMGPSGSGKSTFLHMAAGLDRPSSGTVSLGDTDLARLSERRLTILRRERIGFVFQAFNLLPSLTVTQNIGLPLRLDRRRVRRSQVREVAARVGLEQRLGHRPSQLSGGQQQRVAIARALVTRPEVVFADEPTGALDTRTGRGVLALLREVVDADGHTVVMVTHDPAAAAHADRVLLLADGRLAGTLEAPTADEVAEQLAHLGAE
jgi:putative ABC transport system ATP-binding protein